MKRVSRRGAETQRVERRRTRAGARWSVYRDWKQGEKLDKIERIDARTSSIEGWLQDTARRKGQADASLEAVLMYARDEDSDARDALPEGVDDNALATLLAIIQAEGEDREKLILEQTTMVELLNGFLHAEFAALKDRFDLQDTDLAIIRRDLRKANSTVEFIEWMLLDRESPPLSIPHLEVTANTRFVYSARRVEMRGRKAEMDELADFLACDEKFRWSAWTGLAGMGKSRLALEFCDVAAESGWEVGFFEWRVRREVAWDKWHPDLPTLIVFDYVHEHAESIGKAIGLLGELRELAEAHPEDGAVREHLAKAYGASIRNPTKAKNAVRAADMAEALVPLREAVHSQPGMVPGIPQDYCSRARPRHQAGQRRRRATADGGARGPLWRVVPGEPWGPGAPRGAPRGSG
ncbi:MAG: hypothetical protein Q9O74_08900, partial [Planctomycetota bacterium]|nr:hypothetical protein [Planctomycetota bacterium]